MAERAVDCRGKLLFLCCILRKANCNRRSAIINFADKVVGISGEDCHELLLLAVRTQACKGFFHAMGNAGLSGEEIEEFIHIEEPYEWHVCVDFDPGSRGSAKML